MENNAVINVNRFVLLILFFLVSATTWGAAAAEVKCEFKSLACKENKNCTEHKPSRVFLFGGDVDKLLDMYLAGLTKEGINDKNISKNLEVFFFDEKEKKHTIKVPVLKAAFSESREKLLDYMREKAEGKKAGEYNLSSEQLKTLSKNADIFACVTVSTPPPQKQTKAPQTQTTSTTHSNYDIQNDSRNPLSHQPAQPNTNTNTNAQKRTKSWQVNSPDKAIYIGPELPENFRATMKVELQQEGRLQAGFSVREVTKPNYSVVINDKGSELKKQTNDKDNVLQTAAYTPVVGKQVTLTIERDRKVLRVSAGGQQILVTTMETDEPLTMKRFFIAGSFRLHDLKIHDLKSK